MSQWCKIDVFETFFEVIIHGQGDLAEDNLPGSETIEVKRQPEFLRDQVSEGADLCCLQNLDWEELMLIQLLIDSEKDAVEREKLRRIGSCNTPVHLRKCELESRKHLWSAPVGP